MDLLRFFFCLEFVMPLCSSVYLCLVVTCWERTDLLALVCHFPIGILGQVWYLIVSIPDHLHPYWSFALNEANVSKRIP